MQQFREWINKWYIWQSILYDQWLIQKFQKKGGPKRGTHLQNNRKNTVFWVSNLEFYKQ
jgi:hypothetical protein